MTRRGGIISRDVKAIIYRHVDDGELYVHGFGPHGERIRIEDLADGVAVRRLPAAQTDVNAIARDDGTVTLEHGRGLRLWGEF